MILTIKTDSMHASLALYEDGVQIQSDGWEAGRQLSKDLLWHIDTLVGGLWDEIQAIIVFRGPGSFTSLRIGITTANTIAYSQTLPILGEMGDDWVTSGLARYEAGENDTMVLPEYGSDPTITIQKK